MTTINHMNALPVDYQIQEYKIESLLGYDGFVMTYLARDMHFDSLIILKEYLPQEYAFREGQITVVAKSTNDIDKYKLGLKHFSDEVHTLAKLKHSNIVRVLKFFQANNTAYVVMEYEYEQWHLFDKKELTSDEKKSVIYKAMKSGLTVSEFIRKAIDSYSPIEDNKVLEAMIEQMNKATKNAEKSIDDTLNFVELSNKRINKMEAEAKREAR